MLNKYIDWMDDKGLAIIALFVILNIMTGLPMLLINIYIALYMFAWAFYASVFFFLSMVVILIVD